MILHKNLGPLSALYLEQGVETFKDATHWTHQLSYGRNSDRSDYLLIFEEGKGTCSTKHAALAALAEECGLPIQLKMVICELNRDLDHRVAPLLELLGVEFLPEGHCYLNTPEGERDYTFPNQEPFPKVKVIKEYTITPEEIGKRKEDLHQQFIKNWIEQTDFRIPMTLNKLWKMREEWISSLSQR